MSDQLTRLALLGLSGLLVALVSGSALVKLLRRRPLWRVERVALVLGTSALLAFLWGVFIEADWLEVTSVQVPTAKWPAGRHFRIAHVSDFHVDGDSRALERLAVEVTAAQVDLVVFTGDSLNELGALQLFRSKLGSLPARLGRVAVRGNHDTARWHALELFGGGVAVELRNGPVVFDEGAITLCGAPFNAPGTLPDCLAGAPKGSFTVLAYHTPDLVEDVDPKPDLYLAGHTHGGQVALPFYGALITFSRFDKKYESGTLQVGPTTLHVNRGIGFEPGFPRVRFAARPQLTLIDVEGTSGAP